MNPVELKTKVDSPGDKVFRKELKKRFNEMKL